HAGRAGVQTGCVLAAGQALARRLDANQPHPLVLDVRVEDAHCVAAATDAGNHRIGLAPDAFVHLHDALVADDALEVAHHRRVRVRACDRADDVEGVVDVGDPIAQRFVQRVFEGPGAAIDRYHCRAQQMHAVDVGRLALDVFTAHVDHALHAVARAHGGSGHPVLPGAGLGNHARLAHALGQQRLPDGVVDLVRARVVQVFALQ